MGEEIGLGVLKDLLGGPQKGTFHLEYNGVNLGEIKGIYPIVDKPPIPEENYVEVLSEGSVELTLDDKHISRKRFIKLLMGNYKIQRNEAIKIHNEFMKEHSERTKIGMMMFLLAYYTNILGNC